MADAGPADPPIDPVADEEAALIRAAGGGDRSAFDELYARHHRMVVARLTHLLGPAVAVEDLVQDTFLRAYRALPRFRAECPFRYWLLRIATHTARAERRSARRSIWRLFLGSDEEAATRVPVPAEAEAYPELVAVHAALDRLSAPLREAVILFELEGRTLAEISGELGVSIHTIAARVRRGRAALREHLTRMGCARLGGASLVVCAGEST